MTVVTELGFTTGYVTTMTRIETGLPLPQDPNHGAQNGDKTTAAAADHAMPITNRAGPVVLPPRAYRGTGTSEMATPLQAAFRPTAISALHHKAPSEPAHEFSQGIAALQSGDMSGANLHFDSIAPPRSVAGYITQHPQDWDKATQRLNEIIEASSMSPAEKVAARERLADHIAVGFRGQAVFMPQQIAKTIYVKIDEEGRTGELSPKTLSTFVRNNRDTKSRSTRDDEYSVERQLQQGLFHLQSDGALALQDGERTRLHEILTWGGQGPALRGSELRSGGNPGARSRVANALLNRLGSTSTWPASLSLAFDSKSQAEQWLSSAETQLAGLGAYSIAGQNDPTLNFGAYPTGTFHFHTLHTEDENGNRERVGMLFHAKERATAQLDPGVGAKRNFVMLTEDLEIAGRSYAAGEVIDAVEWVDPAYRSLLEEAEEVRKSYPDVNFSSYDQLVSTFPQSDPQNQALWSFIDHAEAYANSNPAARFATSVPGQHPPQRGNGVFTAGYAYEQTIDVYALAIDGLVDTDFGSRGPGTGRQIEFSRTPLAGAQVREIQVNGRTLYIKPS